MLFVGCVVALEPSTYDSSFVLFWLLERTENAIAKAVLLNGNRVYAGGDDKTITVWDKETMGVVTKLKRHTASIVDLKV